MPVVTLRAPLKQLVGDRSEVQVEGSTLGEVLGDLERSNPKLTGWVLDEQGEVREHVNVFVNGERATLETPVDERARVHIIQNISGGMR